MEPFLSDLAPTTTTRKGEKFLDPQHVTLHCHDFSFESLEASLSPDQQERYRSYVRQCWEEIRRVVESLPLPQQRPTRHVPQTSTRREEGKSITELVVQGSPKQPEMPKMSERSSHCESTNNGVPTQEGDFEAITSWSDGQREEAHTGEKAHTPEDQNRSVHVGERRLNCNNGNDIHALGEEGHCHTVAVPKSDARMEQFHPLQPANTPPSCRAVTIPSSNSSSWENHYRHHQNRFFPIKNYITQAFPSLLKRRSDCPPHVEGGGGSVPSFSSSSSLVSPAVNEEEPCWIIDCGCGTGSVTLPLLRLLPRSDSFICFDVSATAIHQLETHPLVLERGRSVRRCNTTSVPTTTTTSTDPRRNLHPRTYSDIHRSVEKGVPCHENTDGTHAPLLELTDRSGRAIESEEGGCPINSSTRKKRPLGCVMGEGNEKERLLHRSERVETEKLECSPADDNGPHQQQHEESPASVMGLVIAFPFDISGPRIPIRKVVVECTTTTTTTGDVIIKDRRDDDLTMFMHEAQSISEELQRCIAERVSAVRSSSATTLPPQTTESGPDQFPTPKRSLTASFGAQLPTLPKARYIILTFVLCALPSIAHMIRALRVLRDFLDPYCGEILFRDYGVLDHSFWRLMAGTQEKEEEEEGGRGRGPTTSHTAEVKEERSTEMKRTDEESTDSCNRWCAPQPSSTAAVASLLPHSRTFHFPHLCFPKGDGTTQFYFSMDVCRAIFEAAGLEEKRCSGLLEYHCNRVQNRKNGVAMGKVFVNGVFGVKT